MKVVSTGWEANAFKRMKEQTLLKHSMSQRYDHEVKRKKQETEM